MPRRLFDPDPKVRDLEARAFLRATDGAQVAALIQEMARQPRERHKVGWRLIARVDHRVLAAGLDALDSGARDPGMQSVLERFAQLSPSEALRERALRALGRNKQPRITRSRDRTAPPPAPASAPKAPLSAPRPRPSASEAAQPAQRSSASDALAAPAPAAVPPSTGAAASVHTATLERVPSLLPEEPSLELPLVPAAPPVRFQVQLERWLLDARNCGASDLHLSVGEPPMLRRQGELIRAQGPEPVSGSDLAQLMGSVLGSGQRERLRVRGEVDFCLDVPRAGRFRGHAFRQRRGYCASFRVVTGTPPSFQELGLPEVGGKLAMRHQGLLLLAGPAGSGKTTSLTALVHHLNQHQGGHVLTLEDPVEFIHPPGRALIDQREVGTDTESFARGLRAALRQDPDVIVVGELRDQESTALALEAAETGHLVIATLHANSSIQAIDRTIASFPPEEQAQVRTSLSESLVGVLCQQLLRRPDKKGRVAVFEVLVGTPAVQSLIREDKTHQLVSQMQTGRRWGMRTREMALMELIKNGVLDPNHLGMGPDGRAEGAA